MGVTDDDRRMALEQSKRRNKYHQERGDRDNKMAANLDGDEVVRRGLLGECAFANRFGNKVDYTLRAGGDGGRDFTLTLRTNYGVDTFHVDVKTSSIRTVFATVENTTWLRVACDRIKPHTIYIAAIYLERLDDAEVLKWEWGRNLIELNICRTFDNNILSYTKPFKDCRELSELEQRMVLSEDNDDWADLLSRMGDAPDRYAQKRMDEPDDTPNWRDDPLYFAAKPKPAPPAQVMTVEPFLHYCHCGQWGSWGYNYDNRRNGNAGIWYCREHRPPQLVARHSQT